MIFSPPYLRPFAVRVLEKRQHSSRMITTIPSISPLTTGRGHKNRLGIYSLRILEDAGNRGKWVYEPCVDQNRLLTDEFDIHKEMPNRNPEMSQGLIGLPESNHNERQNRKRDAQQYCRYHSAPPRPKSCRNLDDL